MFFQVKRFEAEALHLAAANGQEAVVEVAVHQNDMDSSGVWIPVVLQALLNRADFAEVIAAVDKELA